MIRENLQPYNQEYDIGFSTKKKIIRTPFEGPKIDVNNGVTVKQNCLRFSTELSTLGRIIFFFNKEEKQNKEKESKECNNIKWDFY